MHFYKGFAIREQAHHFFVKVKAINKLALSRLIPG